MGGDLSTQMGVVDLLSNLYKSDYDIIVVIIMVAKQGYSSSCLVCVLLVFCHHPHLDSEI